MTWWISAPGGTRDAGRETDENNPRAGVKPNTIQTNL
jgi:hypothetical protein